MRRRKLLALSGTALALALPAPAAATTPQFADRFVAASPSNYPRAYRSPALIRYVVVHTTEGSYGGTISWFRNPRARVSAHYVVGRGGESTQMVHLTRGAWHAGNGWLNRRSVGIEHEGYAHVPWTLTDDEYRASARIVAGVLRSRVLPVNRRHVIGHDEVPHPTRPWLRGGYSGRTDPGPHWDWGRYMSYVRSYAAGRTPPPLPFDVATPGLGIGAVLGGWVRWEAVPVGVAPARVDFQVNGRTRATLRQPPFVFGSAETGWDTAFEPNGRTTLTVRAVAPDGRVAGSSVVVTIRNAALPPPTILSVGFAEGQVVCGPVRWEAQVTRGARSVSFVVDGAVRETRTAPPYVLGGAEGLWDSSLENPGQHVLEIQAAGPQGVVSARATVFVVPPPCPPPPPG